MPQQNNNFVKIDKIELSGAEDVDKLIEKAKELYLWKTGVDKHTRGSRDLDLEKVFNEGEGRTVKKGEYVNV
ncbi:MAG: hypothetical protein ACXQTP_05845 [Candidatus Methanofastidiosia archaeon]